MTKPVVFIDIDNTLVPVMETISAKNLQALKDFIAWGGHPVFVSGKLPVALFGLLDQLNLDDSDHIGANGGILYNKAKNQYQILAKCGLPSQAINERAAQLRLTCYLFYQDEVVASAKNLDPYEIKYLSTLGDPVPHHSNHIHFEQIIKILFFVNQNDTDTETRVREAMAGLLDSLHFVRTGAALLEIHHDKQTKATGVRAYCEKHQIDLRDTYAIGDSENDLSMLELVGHPYMMANSSRIVKEKGYPELLSCKQDGVASLLYQLIASDQ